MCHCEWEDRYRWGMEEVGVSRKKEDIISGEWVDRCLLGLV